MDFNINSFWPYFLAITACSLIWSYFHEKKRTEALKLTAKTMGFSFSTSGREITQSTCENFELFSKGHSKKLKNEMWGVDTGNNISIFGYSYSQGYGKDSRTYNQTVLSIECDKLQSPNFELTPENAFHKIGQVFGYQDIDFESFPIFSKKYLLRGNDEVNIRKLFTPAVIKFFELNQNLYIEVQGNTLIFYRPSKRYKPDEIQSLYHDGRAVLSTFL